MFLESSYPKNDLLKMSEELADFKINFWYDEEDEEKFNELSYELEKKCFVWFYFIRKLLESDCKITDNIKNIEINIVTYSFIWKKRLMQPFWDWDEYNYKKPNKEKIKILSLSHLFIHSQIFFWNNFNRYESTKIINEDEEYIFEEEGLKFIYVTSDYFIWKKIFEIWIDNIIKIFNTFWNNYVSNMSRRRNNDGSITTICK